MQLFTKFSKLTCILCLKTKMSRCSIVVIESMVKRVFFFRLSATRVTRLRWVLAVRMPKWLMWPVTRIARALSIRGIVLRRRPPSRRRPSRCSTISRNPPFCLPTTTLSIVHFYHDSTPFSSNSGQISNNKLHLILGKILILHILHYF